MMHLVTIHWHRRVAEPGRPDSGSTRYALAARYPAGARNKAVRKFNRHYGMHLAIRHIEQTTIQAQAQH